MRIAGPETRQCPPEFQARVTRMFGVNQFGDPRYKIVWGASQFIRMGDIARDGTAGYRDEYQLDGKPGWHIMRWYPASHYGSPALYYMDSFMPSTGLYATAEYPWRGRYESILSLNSKEMVGGKLKITFLPLSHFMIDTLIPLILYVNRMSDEERAEIKAKNEACEKKKELEAIADSMAANMPTWINPVSSRAHRNKTSILDQRMGQIQQVWNRWSRRGRAPVFTKGIQQADRPLVNKYN
jgi:hypothetical protein